MLSFHSFIKRLDRLSKEREKKDLQLGEERMCNRFGLRIEVEMCLRVKVVC